MKLRLRPYQEQGVAEIREQFGKGKKSVLYVLPTGGGKCLGKGTPVLMHDGTILPVEAVRVGDLLMGPDSNPRRVLSLARGREMMYRVTPVKGDPYVVNESHILSLKRTAEKSDPKYPCQRRTGEVVNISVQEYLGKSKHWKHLHKGWRAAVDFPTQPLHPALPPYILGLWLGDGTSRFPSITSCDHEVVTELLAHAMSIGSELRVGDFDRAPIYRFSIRDDQPKGPGKKSNRLWNALRELDLIQNKHIPHAYKTASRDDRLQLLAGLIDSDGSHNGRGGYDLVFKVRAIADGLVFVARSLGLWASVSECQKTCTNNGATGTYYRVHLSGDTGEIPCRIARKKAPLRRQKKSVLVTGINVEPIGVDDYYGFEIDGDHLFMLGDFTVTHNTVTYAHIAEQAGIRGNRVLILEHRKELIRQASLAAGGLGVYHSIVAPDNKVAEIRRSQVERLGQPMIRNGTNVAVASVQTLARRLSWLQEFNPALIIIDEAHHAVAGTWARIIDALPKARLLGVTATPCRTDGQGLGDVFEAMVLGPSPSDLIDMGNLVRPRIFAPPLRADLSSVHRSKGDYRADELASVLDQPTITGDAVDHYRRLAPGRPAIVFCVNVRHAHHVAATFRDAGFNFHVIHGGMDDGERDRLIYGLANGHVQGLVSVDVISEGTDIPVAEVAIMLRATESESLFLQQAGRVLRPAPNKEYGLIIDHVGNVLRHGRPEAEREWTLEGRKKRERQGEAAAPELRIMQCPECYIVHDPAGTCPNCGHVYEARAFQPRQVDGELQELHETEAERQAREEKQAQRRAQGRAQSVEQMVKQLGYSRARATKILEARQEKERLQGELRDLLIRWSKRTGRGVLQGWGFSMSDVRAMKPKALRESIDKVSEALFMGNANDNEAPVQRRLVGE